jgi:hypothetical protein
MKCLVTTNHLSLARTSEGICSSKFLVALARAGHDVLCLTNESDLQAETDWVPRPWLPGVRCKHIENWPGATGWTEVNRAAERLRMLGRAGKTLEAKAGAVLVYLTGYNCAVWNTVSRWRSAIRDVVRSERPDIIFVRASGLEFEPHIAMLEGPWPIPWVAHYHDPFPISRYPSPYQQVKRPITDFQETLHEKILESADALSFPSRRLLEWVCNGKLSSHRRKAWVLPHLAMDLPDAGARGARVAIPGAACNDKFSIIHSGTLLRHRSPWALLKGLETFIGQSVEKKEATRLVLVGGVDRRLLEDSRWRSVAGANVLIESRRIEYKEALEYVRSAAAGVILEADSPESPFFPAKLADYVWLRKPILALSPAKSVVADCLGETCELRVSPSNAGDITHGLEVLWSHWKQRTLGEVAPGEGLRMELSEEACKGTVERLWEWLQVRPKMSVTSLAGSCCA